MEKLLSPELNSLNQPLNVGLVGAGGFAEFAIPVFLQINDVKLVAITDVDQRSALKLGKEFGAPVYPDLSTLLEDQSVDLVYIATPPYVHYEQAKQALLAGKHVICEKPAALRVKEAEELLVLASDRQLLYVVNLMQRYNPLFANVGSIVREGIFGNFLHGYFENYASDENLNSAHWFWDETRSGGIFIEHGVHFFDLFAGWLGKGEVVNSIQLSRPGVDKVMGDRVQATVLYNSGLVNYYHGFDQPKILDRQEMKLVFEHGDVTLSGWIPVEMKIHGLVTRDQMSFLDDQLSSKYPDSKIEKLSVAKRVNGRFKNIDCDFEISISCGNLADKQIRYQELLTSMLSDQWDWIKDRSHQRIIDANNAIESLRIAVRASELAQKF